MLSLAVAATIAGCAAAEPEAAPAAVEKSTATTSSAITGGTFATAFGREHAAVVENFGTGNRGLFTSCSAVVVGKRHVLTSATCKVVPGDGRVRFYKTENNYPTEDTSPWFAPDFTLVTNVAIKTGVHPTVGLLNDSLGNFADFAVLTLSKDIPWSSSPATIDLSYPGAGKYGMQLGSGLDGPDGLDQNTSLELRMTMNAFWSSSNSSGYFRMDDYLTNSGDEGGPVYYNTKLEGVLSSEDKYTSTAFHIQYILDAIQYAGSSFKLPNTVLGGGTVLSMTFRPSARVCEYSCDTNTACHGYTFMGSLCTLRSALSNDTSTVSGAISGIR